MKKCIFLLLFFASGITASAQDHKLYDPQADARHDIDSVVALAKAQHKFVILMGGGNWCHWCLEFDRFCKADSEIVTFVNKNFLWYHLNWSKENENRAVFAKYGYPHRFGFPVFVVLDSLGNRLHTQNSEYLEDGKASYSKYKVISFFEMWSPWGLDPERYGK